jgi:transcriptional regulator with XRE-family HTH domain
MTIGVRLRELREEKGMSQGDIEKATGLLRCYTSRVENGHTVPSLPTLEKYAGALGLKLFELFYTNEGPPTAAPALQDDVDVSGPGGAEKRFRVKLEKLLKGLSESDRKVFLTVAKKLATR